MKTRKQIVLVVLILLFSLSQETFARQYPDPAPRKKVVVIRKNRKPKIKYVRPYEKPRYIDRVPGEGIILHHGNMDYHYHSGRYYSRRGNRYVYVAPPVGIRVAALPAGFIRIHINRRPYFYFQGVFYSKGIRSRDYVVVDPPEGAIVPVLPEYAHRVIFENKVYYEWNGTIFQKVETIDGYAYEVVGRIE